MPGGGKGGSSSSTVTVNNGPISVDSDSTVDINGLDNIGLKIDPISVTETLRTPDPLVSKSDVNSTSVSTSTSNVATKSDIASDSKNALSVDLKPVVLDVCSTTTTNLPHGEVIQPFNYHIGITWFGSEILGFNFGGESKTIMRDLPKRPAVDWPAQQNAAGHEHHHHHPQQHEHEHEHRDEMSVEPNQRRGEGLRIRLK
ncbi:MAG TPA: hypothetical protein VGM50_22545 [Gemmatimonadaceae bacterium]|jgi:hypothetical protein